MVYKKLNSALYLTPKLLYVVVNLEYFVFYSFRHPFFRDRKVPDGLISFAFGLMQLSTFFTNMGIAFLADKVQRPKRVLVGCLALSILTFQLLFITDNAYLLSFFFIIYSMFILSTLPLLDKIVLDYLKNETNASGTAYGRQRMFGTFTYLFTTYVTESLVYDSGSTKSHFGRLQSLFIVFGAIAVGVVQLMAPADRIRPASVMARNPPQITKVLKNKAYMFFLLIILLNGITRGILTVYLTSYYKGVLNLNDLSPKGVPSSFMWLANIFYKNPVATCNSAGVALEVVIFFFSPWLLKCFGLYWAFLISQVAQCLRFFSYAMIKPTDSYRFEMACCIELLKGINFGMTHISGVHLANNLVPSNLKSTSQMIYTGTFLCLGGMLGSILGHVFSVNTYGGAITMFNAGGLISAIGIVLIIVKYGLIDKVLWGANATQLPEAPISEKSSRVSLASEKSKLSTDSKADLVSEAK